LLYYCTADTFGLENNPPTRAIFTADKLKEFTQIIISKYFILSSFDIQDWEQDPEKFFADQECASKLRSTAESMYQMLLSYDRNTVAQIVVQLLQQILQPQQVSQCNPNDYIRY